MFLLNYDRSKHGCRGRKRNNKRRKKQTTKKLNQPTPRHNNKYKNTSWQNQAFHCRPRSLGRTPADHQQRRPAPLLTAAGLSFPLPSAARSHLPPGRLPGAPRAGKAAAGGRLLSAAPMAHVKALLEQHCAKPHGSHASATRSKAQLEGIRIPGQRLDQDIHG